MEKLKNVLTIHYHHAYNPFTIAEQAEPKTIAQLQRKGKTMIQGEKEAVEKVLKVVKDTRKEAKAQASEEYKKDLERWMENLKGLVA